MARIDRFEDLKCWQQARALTNAVYGLARSEPLSKDFRLCNQLTSAAVSVMSNIAEGFARYHKKDFIRFLDIAQSSAAGVKSLLYVVLDQGFASPDEIKRMQQQSEQTKALTLGLLRYVHRTLDHPSGTINESPIAYQYVTAEQVGWDLPPPFFAKPKSLRTRTPEHSNT